VTDDFNDSGSRPSRTIIGIDWATQVGKRAAVAFTYQPNSSITGVCKSHYPENDNQEIWQDPVCSLIAVDVPFGWPREFVDLMSKQRGVPINSVSIDRETDGLWFRQTDGIALKETGKTPCSVSSDRIARTAHSWGLTRTKHHLGSQIDVIGKMRTERGPTIIEVYPAATLAAFAKNDEQFRELRQKQDNKRKSRQERETIRKRRFEILCRQFEITLDDYDCTKDGESHTFDAMVAALTGLIYVCTIYGTGLKSKSGTNWIVRLPKLEERETTQPEVEGWIFFPQPYTSDTP